MQIGKMAVSGGLKNSCGKKGSEKQRRKGKIYPLNAEFQRIARRDRKPSSVISANRGKQQNGKD